MEMSLSYLKNKVRSKGHRYKDTTNVSVLNHFSINNIKDVNNKHLKKCGHK